MAGPGLQGQRKRLLPESREHSGLVPCVGLRGSGGAGPRQRPQAHPCVFCPPPCAEPPPLRYGAPGLGEG